MIGRALARALVFAAGTALCLAQQPPQPPAAPAAERRAVAVTAVSPRDLLALTGQRLGSEFVKGALPARDAVEAERQRAALRWLDEALAPLSEEACAAVLKSAGLAPPAALTADRLLLPADRPVAAAPAGSELLIPAQLSPLTETDVERLRVSGLLPFEVGLAGEYARAVGASHTGPPPPSALLRLSRAARLEGVARLAGIMLTLRGARTDPAELGLSTLDADKDEAGIPRALEATVPADPVRRALLRTFFEDGLRWALFYYLKGGLPSVAAALERPGLGPEALLRPGLIRPVPPRPPGCALGSRGALALLTGADDSAWIDTLLADSWSVQGDGAVTVWLAFEDDRSASRAQVDLVRQHLPVKQDGAILRAVLKRAKPRA